MRAFGLVLAGGRARRFGAEKALAELAGRPLIAHVVDALGACAAVAVSAPTGGGAADWAGRRGLEVLQDPVGLAAGPLAGILAGLRWAEAGGADALVTAPCDTPFLPRDYVPRLLAPLSRASAAAAATRGGRQPLCSAWRADLAPRLAAILADGHPPVSAVLDALGACETDFIEADAFANLNTPQDLARAAVAAPAP